MSHKHSFLVVDDEPDVLDSVYDLFRRDYDVLRAASAAEAKNLLRRQAVHIVLSDQRMPDVTGVELLGQIREQYPDTVRMLFTGYADHETVVQAINEGQVFRYIAKPWDADELRAVMRQAAEYYDLVQDRKRLIAELQKANADLERASGLKSAFLDVASHELNTPVTFILGMSELAQERAAEPDGEPFRRPLSVVREGAIRLQRLVENMLKLLHAGSFESGIRPEPVECQQLLDSVHRQVLPFLEHRAQRLEIAVQPPHAVLHVDPGKMNDVIVNLVMNAVKFSPDGATIRVQAAAKGKRVRVEVADSGVGISVRDLPHVFEPFFSSFDTLHHSSGIHQYCKRGLGMGLAIVRKFVEMHGGSVDVRPGRPCGIRFIIDLPEFPRDASRARRGRRSGNDDIPTRQRRSRRAKS